MFVAFVSSVKKLDLNQETSSYYKITTVKRMLVVTFLSKRMAKNLFFDADEKLF